MGLDERIFGALFAALRRVRAAPVDPARSARAVRLADHHPRLEALAAACFGERVTLVATGDDGGWAPPSLFVPAQMDDGDTVDDNLDLWRYRIAWSSMAARGGWFAPGDDVPTRRTATLLAVPAVSRALHAEMPGCAEILARLGPQLLVRRPAPRGPLAAMEVWTRALLGGEVHPFMDIKVDDPVALGPALDEALRRGGAGRGSSAAVCALWGALLPRRAQPVMEETAAGAEALPQGAERRGRARDHVREVRWQDDARDENPLTHAFEKVETLEEYRGGRKHADGDDELAAHAEALDELDLREVIRTHERSGSLLRVDGMFEGAAGELCDDGPPGAAALPYDEWEESRRRYRRGWCSVFVREGAQADAAETATRVRAVLREHAGQHRRLRAAAEQVVKASAWRNGQLDGPEVDLDAAVDRVAALRAGETPPSRLYAARRRRVPDLAALLLLDGSLSTDGWVQGRRVLDVTRDAVILLGDAMDGVTRALGVAAFSSNTRQDCRFTVLKGFDEPWEKGQRRVVALRPAGYTRIGPALRHATMLLGRCEARRKLLLLLSDGRPTDFDRYEGRYGVADVRRATQEAHDLGVHTFALAVEREASAHLAAMFGVGHHRVLHGPEGVAEAMADVLLRGLR